ncbi:MAG: EF-P lysine aminoacylase EpmA [Myxococcota bacterium]
MRGGDGADDLTGRVARVEGDALLLQVPGGHLRRVEVRAAGAVRVGDLVRVEPGPPPTLEVLHRHPTGEWPGPGDPMRLADPGRWERLARRADLLETTRALFRERGLLEVETPLVVASPGTEVHLQATEVHQRPGPGEPARTRWLITSPEYHMKRLLAGGAPPIFQVARVFRDGERGRHHRPEFTMIEWYRPWAGVDDIMADCEAWLRRLAGGDTLRWQGHTVDLTPPWPRLPFLEALRTRGGIVEPERLTAAEQLRALVEHVEPGLGHGRPIFLTDYPIAMASLARPKPGDPRVAERFELYAAGLELGNGFGELTNPAEQRRRCEEDLRARRERDLPVYPLDEAFLGALEEGMPPSAGIAAGLDRVVMLLTDAADIDDVLAF